MGVLGVVAAQMGSGYGDHMDWNDGTSWWMVGMMVFFGLAVISLIAWAIVTTSRATHAPSGFAPPPAQSGGSARVILDERFARGEIDATEYAARKQLLG